MPSDNSKRVRTESARQREGRENAEAIKRERAGRKAAAKARKDCRDEAADDDILVEREGESPEVTKLRTHMLQLESDNQRMRTKLTRRDERDRIKAVKTIPEPDNKGDITVEVIREHLGLAGEENDIEWSMIRHALRSALGLAGLNWDKTWSKQDHDRLYTLFQVVNTRCPEMKRFANHWASEFLLKESFGNQYAYLHKQANKIPDTPTPATLSDRSSSTVARDAGSRDVDAQDDDTTKANARMAAFRRAAAYRAAERKAKRKAEEATRDKDRDNARNNRTDENEAPRSDGETEPEDVPDVLRARIVREEIGVPSSATLSLKAAVHRGPQTPSKARRLNPPPAPIKAPAPTLQAAKRPVIYMKRGRGGKVAFGGRSGSRGSVPTCGGSRGIAVGARSDDDDDDGDDHVVTPSSDQTTVVDASD